MESPVSHMGPGKKQTQTHAEQRRNFWHDHLDSEHTHPDTSPHTTNTVIFTRPSDNEIAQFDTNTYMTNIPIFDASLRPSYMKYSMGTASSFIIPTRSTYPSISLFSSMNFQKSIRSCKISTVQRGLFFGELGNIRSLL